MRGTSAVKEGGVNRFDDCGAASTAAKEKVVDGPRQRRRQRQRWGVEAEVELLLVKSVDCVCRKGNDDEEPACCRSSWNSWFTKAELGYDIDAGFEVAIEDTV